jgi:hypothetical protein
VAHRVVGPPRCRCTTPVDISLDLLTYISQTSIVVGHLKMMLEMARERLVDEWDSYEMSNLGTPPNSGTWLAEIQEFHRNGFLPSPECAVELGMQM